MMLSMRFLTSCWVRPILFIAGLFCVLWFSMLPLEAQNQKMTDQIAIREVIEQQLQAFQKDDADKAFSFASPECPKFYEHGQRVLPRCLSPSFGHV
jgi:Domain of unknown function (DUF4864)